MALWYVVCGVVLEFSLDLVLVINGVISLPVAVLAFFFLPDTPGTAKANWIFTERVSDRLPNARMLCSRFHQGNRNCKRENGKNWSRPRRQALHCQNNFRLLDQLEDTALHPNIQYIHPLSLSTTSILTST